MIILAITFDQQHSMMWQLEGGREKCTRILVDTHIQLSRLERHGTKFFTQGQNGPPILRMEPMTV